MLIVCKNRTLKAIHNFDLGAKEKRGRTPEGVLPRSQRRGSIKPLSEDKDTKKGLNNPNSEENTDFQGLAKPKNSLIIVVNRL